MLGRLITMARSNIASSSETAAKVKDANRLGDFQIMERIGCGGMGIVYRARQLSLDRIVAVNLKT